MKASVFYGYICPNCKSTIDVAAMAGTDQLKCPNCKTTMQPNPNGKVISANVHCSKCNSSYGLVNSPTCPQCGTPFAR